jgi:hypothetical protein
MRALGQARLLTGFACGLTALMCAGLLAGAALAQAPPAALVLIVPTCVVLPMLAAWRATVTIASPSGLAPLNKAALGELRRDLARLPETHHPLGF